MNYRALGLSLVFIAVLFAILSGFGLVSIPFLASVEEEEQEDDTFFCEPGPGGIMNECSGSPAGAPCGGTDEYEGVCVEVGFYCDCLLGDGRRFEDVVNDPDFDDEEDVDITGDVDAEEEE